MFRGPVGELARRWRDASRTVRGFVGSTGAGERARVVRFEDLVREPEPRMAAILEFLELSPAGFDWDAFRSLGVRGSSFAGERGEPLDWSGGTPAGADFDPVGRWRTWSRRDLRRFDAVAGAELAHWGYPDSGESGSAGA